MLEYAGLLLLDVPMVAEKPLPDEPWRLGPGLPTHWRTRLALEHMGTVASCVAEAARTFAMATDLACKAMALMKGALEQANERVWDQRLADLN